MTKRIIYYYQTFNGLKSILTHDTKVTHIHLSSIHFGIDENNNPYFDSELPMFNRDHSSPIPSMFVSAIVKVAKKRGYEKIITFTRVDEFAKYLKATGFNIVFTQTRIKKWKSKNADKMYSKSKPSLKNRWGLKVA